MSPLMPIKMMPFLSSIPSLCTDLAMVAGVSAAVLVVCVVVCCVVLCVCVMCFRGRKSTQGNYTIGKPGTARVRMYTFLCPCLGVHSVNFCHTHAHTHAHTHTCTHTHTHTHTPCAQPKAI